MIPKEASQHEANELIICTRCRKKIEDADPRFCPYCGKELFPKRAKARRPNGAGSVTKLSGRRAKPWRARLKHGTISYEVGTFPTSADAMKAIALFVPPDMSQVRAGMTLEDVYRIAVESKAKNLSRSSMETYRAAWRQLEPMKSALVSELKPADYQAVIDGMTGYSRSACEKVRVLVSTIGKWCVANELIGTNPAQFLEMPKKKKKSPENRETFTPEEIETLWTDGSEDALIVLAMIYTGMRINELFALTPADVHQERGITYIVGGEKTDAGRNRVIALNRRIVPAFLRWRDESGDFLLTNSSGGRMNDRNWRVRSYFPLLERLGIPKLNPHKARHTFATLAANAGADPATLQKFLGHADFSTTANIYHHADLSALQKVADLIP